MFWGLFLVLFGGLMLLDRWFVHDIDFLPTLIISVLIAWGGSILFDRGGSRSAERSDARAQKDERAVGEAEIESTTAATDQTH